MSHSALLREVLGVRKHRRGIFVILEASSLTCTRDLRAERYWTLKRARRRGTAAQPKVDRRALGLRHRHHAAHFFAGNLEQAIVMTSSGTLLHRLALMHSGPHGHAAIFTYQLPGIQMALMVQVASLLPATEVSIAISIHVFSKDGVRCIVVVYQGGAV